MSPSIFSAWLAPELSNLYSPVSSPFELKTGSLCMHRSTTDISLLITHSRSSPVFMIAFFDAMWLNSAMRLRTPVWSASQPLADFSDRRVPHAACASA